MWQADDGHILRTISDLTGAGLDPLQNSFAISHDGRWAYVTSFNAIKRIEIDSGKIRKSYTKRKFFRWETVAISPDGHLLAAAHSAGVGSPLSEQNSSNVELLDTESGRVVNQLGKFSKNEDVNSLAYAADGRTVLAMGNDGAIKAWDVKTGKLRYAINHSSPPQSSTRSGLALSPNSRVLATFQDNQGVKLWDMATGTPIRDIAGTRPKTSGHPFVFISALAFSPDGTTLAFSDNVNISFVNTSSGKERQTAFGQKEATLVSVVPMPQGHWIETGVGGISIWAADSGQLSDVLSAKPLSINGATQYWSLSASGARYLAYPSGKMEIGIRDLTHNAMVRTIAWDGRRKHDANCSYCNNSPWNVALSPDGRLVAATLYGAPKSVVRVWEVESGKLAHEFATGSKPDNPPLHVAFSADGKLLYASAYDRKYKQWIKIWSVSSGRLIRSSACRIARR